jgi:hypothetical protein
MDCSAAGHRNSLPPPANANRNVGELRTINSCFNSEQRDEYGGNSNSRWQSILDGRTRPARDLACISRQGIFGSTPDPSQARGLRSRSIPLGFPAHFLHGVFEGYSSRQHRFEMQGHPIKVMPGCPKAAKCCTACRMPSWWLMRMLLTPGASVPTSTNTGGSLRWRKSAIGDSSTPKVRIATASTLRSITPSNRQLQPSFWGRGSWTSEEFRSCDGSQCPRRIGTNLGEESIGDFGYDQTKNSAFS